MTKAVFLLFGLLTAGATYLTYTDVGADPIGLERSIRAGSPGAAARYHGK
jgi:hypothetical protein